jgi:hypothetical protein
MGFYTLVAFDAYDISCAEGTVGAFGALHRRRTPFHRVAVVDKHPFFRD